MSRLEPDQDLRERYAAMEDRLSVSTHLMCQQFKCAQNHTGLKLKKTLMASVVCCSIGFVCCRLCGKGSIDQ